MIPAYGASGLALLASLALTSPALRADSLCLYTYPSGEPVREYALPNDGRFALRFIHSVSKTPVVDQYRLTEHAIFQTAEIFQAHGAGLPSLGNELDARGWRHEKGLFILDLDRRIDNMIVRIQSEYDNTLLINEQVIELASLGHAVLRLSDCNQESLHD